MKITNISLTILFLTGLYGFSTYKNEITSCYLNFNKASKLSMTSPDRLPANSEKVRQLQTETGEVEVSRIDGYRILYNNRNKVPFVNLKVELSDPKEYGTDTTKILSNLKYLNSHSSNMETSDLIKLKYNGYTIYGLSRNAIDEGSTLGSFVMFPGHNICVSFDFNNLKPGVRNFENLADYKGLRNQFIGEYTSHLNNCSGK